MVEVYWLEQAAADVPAADDWLTSGEAARLAGLRVPKRRADWRLGRWTAKRAVAAGPLGRFQIADIEIIPTVSGAPEVFVREQPAALTISLTHSNGVAVCAVAAAGVALGCDLELVEPRSDAFAADYFTAEEQALMAGASEAERAPLVTLVWSAKESALKALRTGLRLDTRDLTVLPAAPSLGKPENSWRPLTVRCISGQIFQGWWRAHGNFILTVAAAPPSAPPVRLDLGATAAAGTR